MVRTAKHVNNLILEKKKKRERKTQTKFLESENQSKANEETQL